MSESRFRLSPRARVLESRDALVVVGTSGDARAFEGSSGPFARDVLALLRAPPPPLHPPLSRVEILEDIAARAEGAFDPKIVDDLLHILVEVGAVLVVADASDPSPARRDAIGPRRRRVVLAVSGAIQAVEAPRLATLLDARGDDVRVVMTDAATRFASALALEAITHAPVVRSMWPHDGPTEEAAAPLRVPHVELARWADVVVVYPASATTLSRIATGDYSDVVSAIAITTRAPVVLAPSMNDAMLDAAAVQRNLSTLVDDGFFVAWPSVGIEVADAPGRRPSRTGPALRPEAVLALVDVAIARAGAIRAPATDWDALFASHEPLPWEQAVDDAPFDEALAAVPPPRSLLDVGTGTGARAIRWAALGYRVVATDIAPAALARARRREGSDRVVFVEDDIRATRLHARFDVVVDRGCFHGLAAADAALYRASVDRLLADDGTLIVLHDGPEASAGRATRGLLPAALAEALGLDLVGYARAALSMDDAGAGYVTRLRRASAPVEREPDADAFAVRTGRGAA